METFTLMGESVNDLNDLEKATMADPYKHTPVVEMSIRLTSLNGWI